MSTPNPLDLGTIEKALGTGALVLGGAAQNWGQDITETFVKGLYELEIDITNLLGSLEQALRMLPLEALQLFRYLFGEAQALWVDVETAVNDIMAQVLPKPIMQTIKQFEDWVASTFQPLLDLVNGILNAFASLLSGTGSGADIVTSGLNNLFGLFNGSTSLSGATSAFSNLNTVISQLLDIFQGNPVTAINAAVQGVKDWWTGLAGQVQHLTAQGQIDAAQIAGQIQKTAVQGLTDLEAQATGTINTLLQGAGQSASGLLADLGSMFSQFHLTAQGASTASAAAAAHIAQQEAVLAANQGIGGNHSTVIFNSPSGLPAGFTIGPGTSDVVATSPNGWAGLGSVGNAFGYFALYTGTQFATDDQSIEVVLGDGGAWNATNTTIYLRDNSDHTQGAYCRINNGGCQVGRFTRSAGTAYTLTPFSGGSDAFGPTLGDRIGFRAVGNVYTVTWNGTPVLTVTDSGNTVATGSAYRYCAFSMERAYNPGGLFGWGAGTFDSFRIAAMAMADYVQPTYKGSGATMVRSGGAVTIGNSGAAVGPTVLPNGFFTATALNTADITPNLTSGSFTVNTEGWYMIKLRLVPTPYNSSPSVVPFGSLIPLLLVNSTYTYGLSPAPAVDSQSNPVVPAGWGDTFFTYLYPGDVVKMAYSTTQGSTWAIGGGSSTAKNYFEICRIGTLN